MISIRTVSFVSKQLVKRTFASESKGEVTALYDFHVEKGGKIVNFGGYLLPVQYADQSIVNSHLFTRKSSSLFDVSHMLQTEIKGKGCIEYIESVCTADVKNLSENGAVLTVFTNSKGGILDDLIITKVNEEHLYVVSNAARKQHDQQHLLKGLEAFGKQKKNQIQIKFFEPLERGLIALQGPKSEEALQKLVDIDLKKLYFMNSITGSVGSIKDCRVTRCGYTGEDGFEISIPAKDQTKLVRELLNNANVKLAGLGARDSLRLEAGLCLYGSDIWEDTTPIEGGLTWLVAKRRRELADFPGAEVILKQIKEGVRRKRIGLVAINGPPARHGAKILSEDGKELGEVTSGCPAPSLGKNVAMGYVESEFSKIGTKVNLKIRDKLYEAVVSKMPFVKANYYNKPK